MLTDLYVMSTCEIIIKLMLYVYFIYLKTTNNILFFIYLQFKLLIIFKKHTKTFEVVFFVI